jgi:hypothetical protein
VTYAKVLPRDRERAFERSSAARFDQHLAMREQRDCMVLRVGRELTLCELPVCIRVQALSQQRTAMRVARKRAPRVLAATATSGNRAELCRRTSRAPASACHSEAPADASRHGVPVLGAQMFDGKAYDEARARELQEAMLFAIALLMLGGFCDWSFTARVHLTACFPLPSRQQAPCDPECDGESIVSAFRRTGP